MVCNIHEHFAYLNVECPKKRKKEEEEEATGNIKCMCLSNMISCKIINELTWPMHATPTFRINCFGWLSGFKANLLSCNWRRKLGAQWTRGDVLIRIDDCVQCLYISCAMGQLQTNNRNVELVWKSFDSIPFYLPLLALLSFWRTIFYRHSEDLGEDFSPQDS